LKVFDCFPLGFSAELDVLEVRLHEMSPLVDKFIIAESAETYGGTRKAYHLADAMNAGRFAEFADKIVLVTLDKLEPQCMDRTTGRLREAYQRNMLMPTIAALAAPNDVISFGDCDEIPRMSAVREAIPQLERGIHRLKQRSFYYHVNALVDYGHDFASRARIGLWKDVEACGTMYAFRMYQKDTCTAVENGGWHFGYFGSVDSIKQKVASLSPFLSEYKLFGDGQLLKDIIAGKDLHHRRCEMPETFIECASDDQTLPQYLLDNSERFKHFTKAHYEGML
jgi:beta-1,4-mannosyl-glycoprotein beta-1,4-N-acetylglucosaminyltransferase